MRTVARIVAFITLLIACREAWCQSGQYIVTGNDVIVRSGPGKNYSKIDSRNKGETVTVLTLCDDDWAEISLSGDKVGYMSRKYLSYSGQQAAQEEIQNRKESLRERLGGMKMDDRGKFWLFVGLAVLFYYLSMALHETHIVLAIFLNLLSAGAMFLWTAACSECLWFLDMERQGFFLWFIFWVLTFAGYMFIGGTALQYLKSVKELFDDFVPSIICVAIGLVWCALFLRLVGVLFDEHPIIGILMVVGSVPSSNHVPTIYVAGEGHITGHGHSGGDEFTGDNGHEYWYDGDKWHRY